MAANDQTYRNQRTLDIVFAVSCVLMLASIIWMFVQDYNREYKHVQRRFRDVELALTERTMLDKMPNVDTVEQAASAVARARSHVDDIKKNSQGELKRLLFDKADREARYQGIKANYDSVVSLWNIAVDLRDDASSESASKRMAASAAKLQQEVSKLENELKDAQTKLEGTDTELKQKQQAQKTAEDELTKAEDNLKKVAADFDRYAKLTAQKRWKWHDSVRDWPVLDAFASPIRIQQFTLAEYPIDYSFKYVTRFDRCMTCHLGIDRDMYDRATLSKLRPENVPPDMQAKLDQARALYERRARDGEQLGFKPSDLPTQVRTLDLTPAEINQYCAHPRLDLFVSPNSPHPAEKFGCSSCHGGQGSATDFGLAAHTPNTSEQQKDWSEHEDWERSHFWDYPMLSRRFLESTCLKCHHQVTDLIRNGNKQEAPKLIKGYNLVRESGCFGCHEIYGMKSGREIGPDLRLEPSPPVETYSPADQAKVFSDPLNPPGKLRKVGPSLFRVSEKTNQRWARKWIAAPRDFRPTTKMPHFYGLSNNRKDPEVLPPEQMDFPETEIASIAY